VDNTGRCDNARAIAVKARWLTQPGLLSAANRWQGLGGAHTTNGKGLGGPETHIMHDITSWQQGYLQMQRCVTDPGVPRDLAGLATKQDGASIYPSLHVTAWQEFKCPKAIA
jgi:hypothetical protein